MRFTRQAPPRSVRQGTSIASTDDFDLTNVISFAAQAEKLRKGAQSQIVRMMDAVADGGSALESHQKNPDLEAEMIAVAAIWRYRKLEIARLRNLLTAAISSTAYVRNCLIARLAVLEWRTSILERDHPALKTLTDPIPDFETMHSMRS